MFTPYNHQVAAVDQSWSILDAGKRPLIVLPTGGGKTAVAAMLAQECSGRVIISCCMVPLIMQFVDDLIMVGIPDETIGILQGDNSDSLEYLSRCRVVVAMSQTLQSPRGAEFLSENRFDMSIADEKHLAHLDIADDLISATYSIGMTATPWRGDGDESLLNNYTWVQPITLAALLAEDKLVDYDHYFYPEDLEDGVFVEPDYVFGQWADNLYGVPTLGFCRTIDEANEYADYFTARGYPCATACDDTPDDEFAASRRALNDGSIHVIFSVVKIATGFNEPCAKGLLICRRIQSISFWVQVIGRILRRDGRGQKGIVLDFFNNGLRLPDPRDIMDWRAIPSASGKTCESCGLKNSNKLFYCQNCGHCLASQKEIAEIRRSIAGEIDLTEYRRLHKPLEKSNRHSDYLDQVGVAKAAREAAFWQHKADPAFAIAKQKELFPDAVPVVHSQSLEGAIFGGEMAPEDLGAYITYLKEYAGARSKPDAWIVAEVRSEGGQRAIDMLRLAAA